MSHAAFMPSTPNAERKDFVCQFCRRRFGRFEHRQRHERLHTNEQPFSCLQCEKRFTRKDLLNRHVNIKHRQHANPATVAQNGQVVPAATEQQQAYDVITDPLWDLPLSQLQFNSYESSLDYLNNDLPTIDHGQISWGNMLDFSLVEETRPTGDMSTLTVENSLQRFTTSHDHPISNTFANHSPGHIPEELSVDEATSLLSASADTMSMQIDQGPFQPQSLAIPDGQQTVTSIPRKTGIMSNLCYESFLLKSPAHVWHLELNTTRQLDSQRTIFSAVIPPTFVMPNRAAYARYFYHYQKNFQPHYPILHSPTFRAENAHLDLILSIAAIGMLFCEENENAVTMFATVRDITLKRVHEQRKKLFNQDMKSSDGSNDRFEARKEILQISQALVMQLILSCVLGLRSSLMQVNELKTVLANFLRDHCLTWSCETNSSWEEWALCESMKRVMCASLSVLTLVTISVNHPPVLMSSELEIELPCPEISWQCTTREEWVSIQASVKPSPTFQTVLRRLLDNAENCQNCHNSALTNHVLMLALLQHFHFLRQLDVRSSNSSNNLYCDIGSKHRTLRKWQVMWESCAESSLDPSSSNRPLAFTSAVLYHTMFVRDYLHLEKICLLDDVDPKITARKIYDSSSVTRNPQMTQAVMHAVCTLAVALRLGFNLAVPDKSPILTLEFAMCALECCVLVTQWLTIAIMASSMSDLEPDEQTVLRSITDLLEDTAPTVLVSSTDTVSGKKHRGIAAWVAKMWAKLFSGTSIPLFVRLRTVLSCYEDLLAIEYN